jgi:hypothetical protein
MLNEARIRHTKAACFLSYIVGRAKDKHVYNNKHDHTQTHGQNMFVTVELPYGTLERGKGKENDRDQQYCIT